MHLEKSNVEDITTELWNAPTGRNYLEGSCNGSSCYSHRFAHFVQERPTWLRSQAKSKYNNPGGTYKTIATICTGTPPWAHDDRVGLSPLLLSRNLAKSNSFSNVVFCRKQHYTFSFRDMSYPFTPRYKDRVLSTGLRSRN